MNISAICPAYNEEHAIVSVLKELKDSLGQQVAIDDFEIILVDDGSTDRTLEVAQRVEGVQILSNPTNMGYGASLKRGIQSAKYDIILIVDGDGTYPLNPLDGMLALMDANVMVVGERDLNLCGYPLARRIAKGILRTLVYALTGRKIKDLNSGLRLLRKEAVLPFFPIISDGFSFTTTITLVFVQSQSKVSFVPIPYRRRSGSGKSKIRPIRDTLRMVTQIFQNIMFFNPLRLFTRIAMLSFFVTALVLVFDIFVSRDVGDTYLFFLITGFAFFFVGLITDLIHKKFSFLESKMEQMAGQHRNQEKSDYSNSKDF